MNFRTQKLLPETSLRRSRNSGINLPSDSSAEDILFDYLNPEKNRIYNDFARRIRSVSKSWKEKD